MARFEYAEEQWKRNLFDNETGENGDMVCKNKRMMFYGPDRESYGKSVLVIWVSKYFGP